MGNRDGQLRRGARLAALVLVGIGAAAALAAHAAAESAEELEQALPGVRYAQAVAYDGTYAYLFGGATSSSASGIKNDAYRFDPATGNSQVLTATLPGARRFATAVWAGDAAYVFGGANATAQLSQILRFDPAANPPFQLMNATLPAPGRSGMSAVWTGEHVYLFGGYDGTAFRKEIYRYDPVLDNLTLMNANLTVSGAPAGLQHTAAAWNGTYAFIFGGDGNVDSDRILRYDPARDNITLLPERIDGGTRIGAVAVAAGAHILVAGGSSSTDVARYTPATGAYEVTSARLPLARTYAAGVWNGTHFSVLGGSSTYPSIVATDTIFRFDPRPNTGAVLDALLPADKSYASSVWTGDKAYLFGGHATGPTGSTDIVAFDPDGPTGPTASLLPVKLPQTRGRAAAVWTGEHAYIFGGTNRTILRFDPVTQTIANRTFVPQSSGLTSSSAVWNGTHAFLFGGFLSSTAQDDVVVYDPVLDTATLLPANQSLSDIRAGAVAFLRGDEAFILGGLRSSTTEQNTVLRYNITNRTGNLMPWTLPYPVAYASLAWDGTHAYVIGGQNNAGVPNSIFRFDPATGESVVLPHRLPNGRADATAVWAGDVGYVFGGTGPANDNQVLRFFPCWPPDVTIAGPSRNGWYNDTATATLTLPPGNCVPQLALDGAVAATASRAIATEGSHTVEGYARGAHPGDVETLRLDLTPPTVAAVPDPPPRSGWWRTPVDHALVAADALSGVDAVEHRLDGGAWATGPVPTIGAEGDHTLDIRATDLAGNSRPEERLAIRLDLTAPVTTATPDGTPGDGGWYRSEVRVDLAAADVASGVNRTSHRLDGGPAVPGPGLTVGTDGEHTVQFWSEDVAGNVEAAQTLAVAIDRVAPVTQHSLQGTPGNAPWWISNVTVLFAASDSVSGVATIQCSLDSRPFQACPTVEVRGDGAHTVAYFARDRAGNAEAVRTLAITIDATPARTTAAYLGPPGDAGWFRGDVAATLTATDGDGSGVVLVQHRVDSGPWVDGAAFGVTGDLDHLVEHRAHDAAGNPPAAVAERVRIDTRPPATTATPGGIPGTNDWFRSNVTVDFLIVDALSGPGETRSKVDEQPAQTGPTAAVEGDGIHNLTFGSSDRAGNVEANQTLVVRIDTTPPEVAFVAPQPGDLIVEDMRFPAAQPSPRAIVVGNVTVRANATDAHSGVAYVVFKVNDTVVATDPEAPYEYLWPAGAMKADFYNLTVEAVDVAGNRHDTTQTVLALPTTREGLEETSVSCEDVFKDGVCVVFDPFAPHEILKFLRELLDLPGKCLVDEEICDSLPWYLWEEDPALPPLPLLGGVLLLGRRRR